MRIEHKGGKEWLISRDGHPPRYFCFLVGSDKASWTQYKDLATVFASTAAAEATLIELRRREKMKREVGLVRKPKPLAEYQWTKNNKNMMIRMMLIGCGWPAIAVQVKRTEDACRAMYNLMTKGSGSQ